MSNLPITFFVSENQRRTQINSAFNEVDRSTAHSNTLLYNTFMVYYQQFMSEEEQYFRDFPNKFPINDYYEKIDFDEMLQVVYDHIAEYDSIFQKNFILYNRKNNKEPYELKFKNFSVKADFSSSNLLDYSYNIKLASEKIRLRKLKAE